MLKKGIQALSQKLGFSKPEDKNEEIKETPKLESIKETISTKSITKQIVNKNEVLITYFAHGTTKDNEQGLFSGQSDITLSDLGKLQMRELPEKLKYDYDVIFISDLPRAIESANLTWPNKNIIQDKRLREINVGNLTSKKEYLVEEYIKDNGFDINFQNGESIKELEKRILELLNYLFDNYKGKHIAILSHKYTQLAIDVLLKGISWEQAIAEDWRKKKAWQPGWNYVIKNKLTFKEIEPKPVEVKKEIIPQELKEEIASLNLDSEDSKLKQFIESPSEKDAISMQTKKEIILEQPQLKEEVVEEKSKVKTSIFTKIKSVFSEKYNLSDNEINDLIDFFELSMLQSDVSLPVCEILKNSLKEKIKKEGVAKNNQEEYLKQLFLDIVFENYPKALDESFFKQDKKPFTILFVGTNGSGKTTNIAKFSYYLKQHNKTCVLAASDTYRAAAIDQLEGHATKLQVPIIKGKYGQDPASVAYDAVSFAKTKNIDFVLVDSSGRQDNALNLMKELEKIKNVIKPDFIVFVAEAIAGQTALMQAESFNKYTNFNAFVLTKTDVDEKGGTLLSISLGLKKPVLFLGVGQEYKDIAFFDKEFLENVI